MKNCIVKLAIFAVLLLVFSASSLASEPEDDFDLEVQEEFEHDNNEENEPATSSDASPRPWGVIRKIRRAVRRVVRRIPPPKRWIPHPRRWFPQCRQSKNYRRGPHVSHGRASDRCIRETDPFWQARCWAPRIFLAVGEHFKPSSVGFFLKNVYMFSNRGRLLQRQPRPGYVKPYRHAYLRSKRRLPNANSIFPFFYGQNPRHVPIYAFYKTFTKGRDVYRDFVYFAFFPYNRGKHVCMGGVAFKKCFGKCRWFGNHVGDWEHVRIRLKNNYPQKMYISAHDFGGTYHFDRRRMTFRKGGDTVKFTSCGHPIVFAAKGSHGFWTRQGIHTYKKFFWQEKLQDLTSTGVAWDTWANFRFIKFKKRGGYKGQNSWLNFKGEWGNKERHCLRVKMFNRQFVKQCTLSGGPGSLNDRGSLQNNNW